MTQTTAITRFNTTSQPQTQTQSQPQPQAQPKSAYDELEQLYNGLKETQALYNDQLAAFGRKIKEVALADRQRTREFNDVSRRLERIKQAI